MQYNEIVEFEWDDFKAAANLKKHGVRFSEAASIWKDELSLEIVDSDHSNNEERWVRIGRSHLDRTLVVVFTERLPGTRIRIISARKATRSEEQQYFARHI